MGENPFTYGNPISHPSRFAGRGYEVEQIFSRLRNAEFESSSVAGERRMGKTSLLKYLAHPAIQQSYGLSPSTHLFIYVDLQILDQEATPTRLWQHILHQMAWHCYDEQIKQTLKEMSEAEPIDSFALADFFHNLDERGLYVVFLLDEFENVTKNPHFELRFFYELRSLAIHHHLALITSSRQELIELCHSEAIRSSPFFNIFSNFNLNLFNEAEARGMIFHALQGSGIAFTPPEIDTIFSLAGYHPYFLQVACHFLFEAYTRKLHTLERLQFLYQRYFEQAVPHFEDYWQHSREQEKVVLTMLALLRNQQKMSGGCMFSLKQLQDIYARSEQVLGCLEKRGLVVSYGHMYTLFNTSFSDWICREITNTLDDSRNYQDWLRVNRGAMCQLPGKNRKDLEALLPHVGRKFRELLLNLTNDPKSLYPVVALFKGAIPSLEQAERRS